MTDGGRFGKYRTALSSVSARTGAPLPSLVVSFGILHELTAIVPLVGVFYAARVFGVGERVVSTLNHQDSAWIRTWIDEGEGWAYRVGRRYGVFGYDKRGSDEAKEDYVPSSNINLAGDVANAVFAYGATKALLPVRVGVSLYFAPAFSRALLEPFRRSLIRVFRR